MSRFLWGVFEGALLIVFIGATILAYVQDVPIMIAFGAFWTGWMVVLLAVEMNRGDEE